MKQLSIFAKYWQPGQVKTRLAASIGAARAAALQQLFFRFLVTRLADSAERCAVVFSPSERNAEFRLASGDGWHLCPQSEGDLGARLRHHVQAALNDGVEQIVIVGADSPTLPMEYVEQAFRSLESHSVVLGPSQDGGYYLVGTSGTPPIFEDIDWGTESVLQQTMEHLKRASISYTLLPEWYDIDTLSDLEQLICELDNAPTANVTERALRKELVEILESM